MLSTSDTIQAGDTVILYQGYKQLRPLHIVPGQKIQTKEGIFEHSAFVGAPYGSWVQGRPGNRTDRHHPTLLALRNTSDLWTQALPRRTQIIFAADIAVIVQLLRLRPGSVVAEAGTGSGSLTHALATAVAPNGRVFTFDFHAARAAEARAEFERTGVSAVVTAGWADVCTTPPAASVSSDAAAATTATAAEAAPVCGVGFGLPPSSVDAVFLDVPMPWLAVDNVLAVLRPNGILCTFSPCIEQTQRLCEALRSGAGRGSFVDIRTVEALTREHRPVPVRAARAAGGDAAAKRARGGDSDGECDEPAPTAVSATAASVVPPPLFFKGQAAAKGHSAFLTFARRRPEPTPEALRRLAQWEREGGAEDTAAGAAPTVAA